MNLGYKIQFELRRYLRISFSFQSCISLLLPLPRACSPGDLKHTDLPLPAPSSCLRKQSEYCASLQDRKYPYGSRLLPDLTDHLTTQADGSHAISLSVLGKPFRLTFILLSLLVRFAVWNPIEPHASLLVVLPRQFL
jgi:hypothetical protein